MQITEGGGHRGAAGRAANRLMSSGLVIRRSLTTVAIADSASFALTVVT